jgi:outer membrane protein
MKVLTRSFGGMFWLSVAGLFCTQVIYASEIKIAVVDMQKALQSVEAGKKAKATLEKEFNEKKKTLLTEEETIKKMSEEFKKQSLALSEDARNKKQNEIQERLLKYRELFGKSQMDIQNRERDLTAPIIEKLKKVIGELGNNKSYTIILEKNENSVLYSQSKDDLTDEVIKKFNQ